MRGFVSYLFLVLIASIGVSQYALQTTTFEHSLQTTEIQSLAFTRSELEQGMDRVIAEELRAGMIAHLSSTEIKSRTNQALMNYLQAQQNSIAEPTQMELGFASMQTTHYFSLLHIPLQPLSVQALDSYSHVFVLPLNQTQQYGEYTYTGGAFGTNILIAKLFTEKSQTLAALPSGYRRCVQETIGEIPCA